MRHASEESLMAFEAQVKALWEQGGLPCLLHLCGGNEPHLVRLFDHIEEGDWIFSTHRNHYHALCAGIPPEQLLAGIMEGRSMFTYSKAHNFFCSAILAGNTGIAAGVAWAIKRSGSKARVHCFLGDGAEEQGHFYEAVLFVESNQLPCHFYVEDNNRQVDTARDVRRGKSQLCNRPLDYFRCVSRYEYAPTYPHAGSGAKPGTITFKPEAIERMKP